MDETPTLAELATAFDRYYALWTALHVEICARRGGQDFICDPRLADVLLPALLEGRQQSGGFASLNALLAKLTYGETADPVPPMLTRMHQMQAVQDEEEAA